MADLISRSGWSVPFSGTSVRVPFCPAERWISALQESGPATLLAVLARPATGESILDTLAAGEAGEDDLSTASYKLIEYATGYKWWEAFRLMTVSVRPDVLGRTVLAGMDPWFLTPGQWCSGVYALFTKDMGKDDLFKFDAMLGDPPEGVDDDEWATEDFDAMVAAARAMPGQK